MMRPKAVLVTFNCGSARLVWLVTLVNETPASSLTLSVRLKDLITPSERLEVPGPVRIPTPAVPNRPIGAASRVGLTPIRHCAATRVVNPGQTNAFGSNHWNQVGFEMLPLAIRSGC